MSGTIRILVDADACTVKDEIYRVAGRHAAGVVIVSNSPLRAPPLPFVQRVVVGDGFDAADDWIAETADAASIIVTADILLADRCLKVGARVVTYSGRPLTQSSIGNAVAVRAIMADLRAGGDRIGGPAPFTKSDRSAFLQTLDRELVALRRATA